MSLQCAYLGMPPEYVRRWIEGGEPSTTTVRYVLSSGLPDWTTDAASVDSVPDSTQAESVVFGNRVSAIGSALFQNAQLLLEADLSETDVVDVAGGCFMACRRLSSVGLPPGAGVVRNLAFAGCYALSTLSVPSSVSSIANQAFQHCGSLSATFEGRTQAQIESMTNYPWGITCLPGVQG